MKNLLFLAFIALLSGTPAFAQSGTSTLSQEAEQKCTNITRAMAVELHLNEPGYIKLKQLNREKMGRAAAALANYGHNTQLLTEQLQNIEAAYEEEIKTFLTPEQVEAYHAYKQQPEALKLLVESKDN